VLSRIPTTYVSRMLVTGRALLAKWLGYCSRSLSKMKNSQESAAPGTTQDVVPSHYSRPIDSGVLRHIPTSEIQVKRNQPKRSKIESTVDAQLRRQGLDARSVNRSARMAPFGVPQILVNTTYSFHVFPNDCYADGVGGNLPVLRPEAAHCDDRSYLSSRET
jgi:hypothetical protein